MNGRRQMMVFISLVLVLIGQFCRDVIGRQNVKVIVIGRLLLLLFSKVGRKVVETSVTNKSASAVDMDMLNAVKSLLADVSSVSPSSER